MQQQPMNFPMQQPLNGMYAPSPPVPVKEEKMSALTIILIIGVLAVAGWVVWRYVLNPAPNAADGTPEPNANGTPSTEKNTQASPTPTPLTETTTQASPTPTPPSRTPTTSTASKNANSSSSPFTQKVGGTINSNKKDIVTRLRGLPKNNKGRLMWGSAELDTGYENSGFLYNLDNPTSAIKNDWCRRVGDGAYIACIRDQSINDQSVPSSNPLDQYYPGAHWDYLPEASKFPGLTDKVRFPGDAFDRTFNLTPVPPVVTL